MQLEVHLGLIEPTDPAMFCVPMRQLAALLARGSDAEATRSRRRFLDRHEGPTGPRDLV